MIVPSGQASFFMPVPGSTSATATGERARRAILAAACTADAHGFLVRGYRLSFLVSVVIVAVAAAIVLLRLRTPHAPDAWA